MRLLLDTHILLWAIADSRRLSAAARELLESETNSLYCSTASLWEIAIKNALGRSGFAVDLPRLRAVLPEIEVAELPVLGQHAEALGPLSALHKDPFDRMLVAQAQAESMHLLTNDALLSGYAGNVILV